LLISGRNCNLLSIRAYRAVAIGNESPISMRKPVLKGSCTLYLSFAVREWVETKCLLYCSSSSLRGSFWGISSSSQNLHSNVFVSHSEMQNDNLNLVRIARSDIYRTGYDPIAIFLTVGVSNGSWRRSPKTTYINLLRLANGSVADLLDLDPPT
jgi:hypothetical protein